MYKSPTDCTFKEFISYWREESSNKEVVTTQCTNTGKNCVRNKHYGETDVLLKGKMKQRAKDGREIVGCVLAVWAVLIPHVRCVQKRFYVPGPDPCLFLTDKKIKNKIK